MECNLYIQIRNDQWPIIYRKEYNVHFFSLERLHPFDARKWENIFNYLNEARIITEETVIKPNEATKEDLLVVHSKKYLKRLNCSIYVAQVAEVPVLILVPNCLIQSCYLCPMRYQTGGSILAGKVALERGWAINIGGGFHHCSSQSGGGFCPYADITLLITFLFKYYSEVVKTAMIVDLDAHQGNGYERDFKDNERVYILDVYNGGIYPFDKEAKKTIRLKVELQHHTRDTEYLREVKRALRIALNQFKPDILVYNAGTDILEGDPLGGLSVSETGIIQRDALVFKFALGNKIPIAMLTSGGYQKRTAKIIANSIINLKEKGLINGPLKKY